MYLVLFLVGRVTIFLLYRLLGGHSNILIFDLPANIPIFVAISLR